MKRLGLLVASLVILVGPVARAAELPPPTISRIIETAGPYVLDYGIAYDGRLIISAMEGPAREVGVWAVTPAGAREAIGDLRGQVSLSPDGRHVVGRVKSGWKRINLASGKERLIAAPTPHAPDMRLSASPHWSRDGTLLAFAFTNKAAAAQTTSRVRETDGVRFIDVGADLAARPGLASEIHVVDLEAPEDAPKILSLAGEVRHLAWGHQDQLFFSTLCFVGCTAAEFHTEIKMWKIGTDSAGTLFHINAPMQSLAPLPSPDGRYLAVAVDLDARRWTDFPSLAVLDPKSRQLIRLSYDLRIEEIAWLKDSDALAATARRGGYSRILRIDLEGRTSELAGGDRRYDKLRLSPDGAALFYHSEDGYGRQDIRRQTLDGGAEEQIVRTLDDPPRRFGLGRFEQISWPNGEGQQIHGFLIYPPDFDGTRLYPMLVDVHGGGPGSRLYLSGPLTSALAPGPLEWHAWAAHGFIVFVPDYRSSGSYGAASVLTRYRDHDFAGLEADVRDIEAGTAFVLRQGFVDPGQLSILGHSAGGARAALLLARTELFKVGILNEAIAGGPFETFVHLTTGAAAGQAFEPVLKPMLGGGLADMPHLYGRDYILELRDITAPTLILSGADPAKNAVSPILSETAFSILRQNQVPTRLLRFVDEGHNYGTAHTAQFAFETMLGWIRHHITGTEDGS